MGENNNEPREIVVSLKKLKTYVNTSDFKQNNSTDKIADELIGITNLMDGKHINDVQREIIEFVKNKLSKFNNNIKTVVIVFILVNFAFRKGFRNETKVKFDKSIKSNLKTKIAGASYDVTGHVETLLSNATALSDDDWKSIRNLAAEHFTASKLQRAARMLRKGVHAPKHVYKKIKSVISAKDIHSEKNSENENQPNHMS